MPDANPKRSILLRTIAGRREGVSYGHLFRCIELASCLSNEAGSPPFFAVNNDDDAIHELSKRNIKPLVVEGDTLSAFKKVCETLKPAAVILDLPQSRPDELAFAQQTGALTVVMDDHNIWPDAEADIMISGRVTGPQLNGPQQYAGPSFIVLRKEFKPTTRQRDRSAKNVLVTFGGSDPSGLTEKVVPIAVQAVAGSKISVLLGLGYVHRSNVLQQLQASGQIDLIHSRGTVSELFRQSDIAISAGGITAHELAACGTPTILVPSIDHEVAACKALADENCGVNLGRWSKSAETRLRKVLPKLLTDDARRDRMSAAGPKLLSANGADRIIDIIFRNIAAKS